MAEKTFDLDFSGVGPLPEDKPYLVTIGKFEAGSSKKGDDMITAEFNIEAPEDFANRKVFRNFMLLPQSLFSLYGLLAACGEKKEKLEKPGFKFDPEHYQGKQVTMWVKTEESEEFGDRSIPRRFAPASAYEEAAAA